MGLLLSDNDVIKWEKGGKKYALHIQHDDDPENPREYDNIATLACFHRNYALGDSLGVDNAEEFWRGLVKKHVSSDEIYEAVASGKLESIRIEQNERYDDCVDIYETYCLRTVVGTSEAAESLEYEAVRKDGVADWILDDLTIGHCMALLEPYVEWMPLWLYDHSGISISCGERVWPYNDPRDSGQVGWVVAEKDKVLGELCSSEEKWREDALRVMRGEVETYNMFLLGECYGYTLYEMANDEWVDAGDSCWGFLGDDPIESGLADEVGNGFAEAVKSGDYEVSTAREVHHFEF